MLYSKNNVFKWENRLTECKTRAILDNFDNS